MLNEKLERSERERKRDQKLLYESVYLPKIRRRYFRYKLKSVFSWGKKRKKYKRMKKALKEEIRTIGKMLDGGRQGRGGCEKRLLITFYRVFFAKGRVKFRYVKLFENGNRG